MNQALKKSVLLVDYENIQTIDLSLVKEQDVEIKIFVGQSQNKIPLELVQATQGFGQRVEWIKIEGIGNNSLDFHIAFYLGSFSQAAKSDTFIILSKDKGFDPLVKYIKSQNVGCQRVESLLELFKNDERSTPQDADLVVKIVKGLSKIQKNKRPKTRKALHQHIKAQLNPRKPRDREVDALVNTLLIQHKTSEISGQITYNF